MTASTPNGLLVKITEVDGAIAQATQASLQAALEQGEFWVERELDPLVLRGEPKLASGVKIEKRPRQGRRSPAVPMLEAGLPDKLVIDSEVVKGVRVKGTLDFGVGCGLDGGVGGSDWAWFEVGCKAWEEATLSIKGDRDALKLSKRIPVGYFPLQAVAIPVGPMVIVVIVDILVTIDLSGTVHLAFQYGASEKVTVTAGAKISLRHGLDHNGGVELEGKSEEIKAKASLNATSAANAELRASLFGVLGVSNGAFANLDFNASVDQTKYPSWTLSSNAGIYLKVFLGILGIEAYANLRYTLPKLLELSSANGNLPPPNSKPTIEIVSPTNGMTLVQGTNTVEAYATDEEDGKLPVEWFDSRDKVTVKGKGKVTLPFKTLGEHNISVSATDSAFDTTYHAVMVKVVKPKISMMINALTLSGNKIGIRTSSQVRFRHLGGLQDHHQLPRPAFLQEGEVVGLECHHSSWGRLQAQGDLGQGRYCRAQGGVHRPERLGGHRGTSGEGDRSPSTSGPEVQRHEGHRWWGDPGLSRRSGLPGSGDLLGLLPELPPSEGEAEIRLELLGSRTRRTAVVRWFVNH